MFICEILFYQAETLNSQLVTEGKKRKDSETSNVYNI